MAQESGGTLKNRGTIMGGRLTGILVLLVILWICVIAGATKCYKNDDLGEIEENVYYCDGDKSDCCQENQEFTCCEPTSKKTLREQLILWGGVLAVGLVVAAVCLYFWKDCNCLREDTRCSRSCCCRKKRVDEKPLTTMPDPRPTTSWAPSFRSSRGYEKDLHDEDSPPPFYYKSLSDRKY